MRILFSPDATEGGAPADETPATPAAPAPATPAPPPAAAVVAAATVTEQDADLAATLETERAERRKAELKAMELEDENFRLKEAQKGSPIPKPRAEKSGWGFFAN